MYVWGKISLLITAPLECIELLEGVGHYFAWDMVEFQKKE